MGEGHLHRRIGRLVVVGMLGATAAVPLAAAPASAATITVTNTIDSGPGSLRAAIAAANADPLPDVIDLGSLTGTITLTSGELLITQHVTIRGPGAHRLAVSAGGASRVFAVASGTDVTIEGITITGGRVEAGDGQSVTVTGGDGSPGGDGGGVPPVQPIDGSDQSLTGTAGAGAGGGGIANAGGLTLVGVVVTGNVAEAGDGGDAEAVGGNGGDGGDGGNPEAATNGGNGGDATATGGDGGTARGGGIYNAPTAILTIRDSTIADNEVRQGDGGDASARGGAGGDGGSGFIAPLTGTGGNGGAGGGAVAAAGDGGAALGAAIYSDGFLTVHNTSVYGNRAVAGSVGASVETGGAGGAGGIGMTPGNGGNGGTAVTDTTMASTATAAVYIGPDASLAQLVSVTLADNAAPAPHPTAVAGLAADRPLGVSNSIVAGAGPLCTGAVNSSGFNLDQGTSCGFTQATDRTGTDPLLEPPALRSGTTPVLAPTAASPAVDAGAAFGLTTDQHGVARPVDLPPANAAGGDGSDIGAVELAGTPPGGGGPGGPGASGDADEPCPPDLPDDPFTDVDADSPHRDAIRCAWHRGLTSGTGPTTFAPNATTTRGQVATFVARLLELAAVELPADPPDAFGDDDGDVHEPSIDALAALGVVHGTGPGTFDPHRAVSRGQLATFLVAASALAGVQAPEPVDDAFTDDDGSVHEAAIDAAAALGIATGVDGGGFAPGDSTTRAQVASFLTRVLAVLADAGAVPSLP